jgi:hypothetical protein
MHLDRHAITYRSLIRRRNWSELPLLTHGSGRATVVVVRPEEVVAKK